MVLLTALWGCDPVPPPDDCNWTVSPFDGQTRWDLDRSLSVGAAVDAATAGVRDAFRLEGPDGPVDFDLDLDPFAIEIEPRDLSPSTEYALVVGSGLPGGRNVEDLYRPADHLVGRYVFYTGSLPRPICTPEERCVQFSEDIDLGSTADATVSFSGRTAERAQLRFMRGSTSILCLDESQDGAARVYLPDGIVTGTEGAALDGDGDGRPGGAAILDFAYLPPCNLGCGSPWTSGGDWDTALRWM